MVLDSAALVTFFCGEPGAVAVGAALEQPTFMSAFSALELAAALPQVSARELQKQLMLLGVKLMPLEADVALELGVLEPKEPEAIAARALAKAQGLTVFSLKST